MYGGGTKSAEYSNKGQQKVDSKNDNASTAMIKEEAIDKTDSTHLDERCNELLQLYLYKEEVILFIITMEVKR